MGMFLSISRRRLVTALAAGTALATVSACAPATSLLAPDMAFGPHRAASNAASDLLRSKDATAGVGTTAHRLTPDERRVSTAVGAPPRQSAIQAPLAVPPDEVAIGDRASDSSRAAASHTQTPPNSAPVAQSQQAVSSTTGSSSKPSGASAATTGVLYFGAVGDVATLNRKTGSTLGVHSYGNFSGSVPAGRMITVNASGATWRTVSGAKAGSKLYGDMVRWAKTIKARGGSIQLAFGHEPELSSKTKLGTAAEYKSAYQSVVRVFRSQGVTNVQWVFQATDWGFRTKSTDPLYAGKFYPGDSYIDVIGGDAYNWHICGEGRGKDVPLSTVAGGVLSFAKAHGKYASLPEFGANTTINRTQWLNEGFAWLKSNKSVFISAFYFQHPPTNKANSDCNWPLRTESEFAALKKITTDTWSRP